MPTVRIRPPRQFLVGSHCSSSRGICAAHQSLPSLGKMSGRTKPSSQRSMTCLASGWQSRAKPGERSRLDGSEGCSLPKRNSSANAKAAQATQRGLVGTHYRPTNLVTWCDSASRWASSCFQGKPLLKRRSLLTATTEYGGDTSMGEEHHER